MTHVNGQQDKDLHNEDGSHRGCPSTNGHQLELWEERLRRHLDSHAPAVPGDPGTPLSPDVIDQLDQLDVLRRRAAELTEALRRKGSIE